MTATAETTTPQHAAPTGRAPYTSVAVTGLVLAGLAPALMLVLAMAFGIPVGGELGLFAVAIAVPWLVAVLVWRFGTWAKVLGVLASLVSGLLLFWLVFGLQAPSSFGDFVPAVLLPLGVLLGLIGSIAAIVAGRRTRTGQRTTGPAPGERVIVGGALGLVAIAVLLSATLNVAGRTTVDEGAAAGAATATMRDYTFVEGTYQVASGQDQRIVVRNDDPFLHDFVVPELGIAVDVLPGSAQLVEIDAPAGEYTVYCTLHSDTSQAQPSPDDMAATLIVE